MRKENRKFNELRNIEIIPDVNIYAEGSCLIKCGNTHVLCTASVDDKLPSWLKGENKGWITAEYSLLPRATHTRVSRETKGIGGRTAEIQRLIGRALRAIVDLEVLKDLAIIFQIFMSLRRKCGRGTYTSAAVCLFRCGIICISISIPTEVER